MDSQATQLLERASALRLAGRVDEAIDAYEQLLEREPDLPDSWYNLGWLLRQARRYDASLAAYRQALDRGVSEPEEVHLNQAVILSDHLARPDEAEAELRAAIALNPRYLPALLNLGNLHEDLGNRKDAETAYRGALDIAPAHGLALSRLAGVVDAQAQTGAELVERLGRALSSGEGPAERAGLGFALGRLLDARGEFEQAFATYEGANRASRESFGPRFAGYDQAAHEQFVDRLIAEFVEPSSRPDDAAAPVFVCGMFRSGSTLVEQILGSHSGVKSGGELDLIPAIAARIADYPQGAADAGEAALSAWRCFYLDGIAPFASGDCLITDKRPDNFLHIGLIKTIFPNAKIIHTHRNRLDNLLSLYFLHLDPQMSYALNLADAAHWYGQYERLMAHWKTLYADDILDVGYDALVSEPKPRTKRLLAFLGLGWEDQMLDFHLRQGAVKTASVWQVREPLHARSSGRWRNYSKQLERALGEPAR
ncbi:MAG: sulfotransferase [Sphingomonas sp.]|nr:sulfotransferase [Sphingomonas sp.]